MLKDIVPPEKGGINTERAPAPPTGSPGRAGGAPLGSRAPWGEVAQAPLGKIAKFAANQEWSRFRGTGLRPCRDTDHFTDDELGVIRAEKSETDAAVARMDRWKLKAEAVKALGVRFDRVARCHRYRLGMQVDVWHFASKGSAAYGGLETCANVWCCPLCAAKISERRRVDLIAGVNQWRQEGHSVALMSLTFPHGAGDSLTVILDAFLKAYRRLTGHRSYRELQTRYGIQGAIRALEVTHGRNGWHPHAHILLFLDAEVDQAQLVADVYPLWVKACALAGLPAPSLQHGVDVSNGDYAARYASKWGLESEVTKGMQKRGEGGNRSPWDLLRSSLADDDAQARALFAEYALAFKGKKQLVWSRGLRAMLELAQVEATDDELAGQLAGNVGDRILAQLDADQWRKVTWARAEGQLLEVARSGDGEQVLAFVDGLRPAGRSARPGARGRPRELKRNRNQIECVPESRGGKE